MSIRVGLIGCGFIGGIHSHALRGLIRGGLVDATVVAVADADVERAQSFAAAHGDAVATADANEVIDRADAVWVCTPTDTHRPLVEAVAASGRAIYCEKPLAPTMEDVAAVAHAVAEAGIPHQVGLVLRHAAPIVELRRLIGEDVGRAMAAVLRDDQYFPIQGRYASEWRADVVQAGGGTLIEHSIHDLDALAWLLGPVVEVSCRTANYAGHPGIEDVAMATLVHQSGATSTLVSVWHQILSRPSTRRLEVFCERALLWLDDEGAGPVHVETAAEDRVVDAPTLTGDLHRLAVRDEWRAPLSDYASADRAFLQAVATGQRPQPGFDVAVRAHQIAAAAYRSAASGGRPTAVALL